MNIFNRIILGEYFEESRLGSPLHKTAAIERRMNIMSSRTGGKGFRVPPRQPPVDAQGMTRGDRKRATRAACNEAERKRQETAAKIIVRREGVSFEVVAKRFGALRA